MRHNKIIFLDIDGVINIPPYASFNEECVSNLEYIIANTGAKIVVSSSWRDENIERMKDSFLSNGFTDKLSNDIIGITCRGYSNVIKGSKLPIIRGNEIKAWVDTELIYPWHANPQMDEIYRQVDKDGQFVKMNSNKAGKHFSYVILDDDNDMLLEQARWFINTDSMKGITKQNADDAIRILNIID